MLRGFYLRFGTSLDRAINRRIQGITQAVLKMPHPALTDIIPGYSTLYLEYDGTRLSEAKLKTWLETFRTAEPAQGRQLTVPVCYDGPDLSEVAEHTGLTTSEIVARHSAREYHVYALGFTPGLAFMGDLEHILRLPRRDAPRAQVEAQSVAIANAQTTVYPVTSPGGWHLLGRTAEPVYRPTAEQPFLLSAGDQVRFQPVAEAGQREAEETLELLPTTPQRPLLEVSEPGLLDIVVDRGRFLAGYLGFARSGPLDMVSAGRANRLVGNSAGAALLELNVRGGVYEAVADGVLAFAGGGLQARLNGKSVESDSSFAVDRGDRLSFVPAGAGSRGYLAVAGGLESRLFRGSASVDLRGRIGRALRAGDVLGTTRPHAVRAGRRFSPYISNGGTLRLIPGPQRSATALAALTRQTFTVGRADRMGVQLLGAGVYGAGVPGGEVLSEAVPLGSVQVPPGGTPLLLLNDRGTLGGYAKPAVLYPADLPRAAQLRSGQKVRFKLLV